MKENIYESLFFLYSNSYFSITNRMEKKQQFDHFLAIEI